MRDVSFPSFASDQTDAAGPGCSEPRRQAGTRERAKDDAARGFAAGSSREIPNPGPALLHADGSEPAFRNVPFPLPRAERTEFADLTVLRGVSGEQNGFVPVNIEVWRNRRPLERFWSSTPALASCGRMKPSTNGHVAERSRPVFVMKAMSGFGSLP